MNLREAVQQALEALDLLAKSEHPATNFTTKSGGRIYPHKVAVDAGAALRTALAEPEQEPVAWGVFEDRNLHDPCFTRKDAEELARLKGTHAVVQPLYTHPPQRKPLTEEEIVQISIDTPVNLHAFARAIERAHGIGGEA
jgi:hypothetical protein